MTAVVGAGALVRLILRRDRLLLPLWIAVLALLPIAYASSFAASFPTAASRQAFADGIAANPAELALLGPVFGSSIGGLTAWRSSFVPVLVALASLLTVIRHTRTEEAAGRRELLGATVVGRQAALAAGLGVTLGADALLAAAVAGGLIGLGLPAAGSVALGLSLATAGWIFAAVAGLAAQLTEGAGAARGLAGATLGLVYLLRAAGDAGGDYGRLSWLTGASPLGWTQRTRPFADERWWLFALPIGLTVALTAGAAALSARRDLGAGVLPPRPGPAAASPALRSPLALAWRLHRSPLLAWTTGFALVGAVVGGAAEGTADQLKQSGQLADLIARLGGQTGLADAYLATTMGILGLAAAAYAVQAASRPRSEEAGRRAEPVLATAVGRLRWATSHLVFAAIGPALVLAAAGATAGLTYGASVGAVGRELPRLLTAALVQLPAVWVVGGIAVALFGLLPRLAAGGWAALAVFLLLGQVGEALRLDRRVLTISPFSHLPKLPGGAVAAAPPVWLLATAAALTAAGLVGFRRRDVG